MAFNPARDTCATCIHFQPSEDDEEDGEYHRMPPSYIARLHLWSFAAVTSDNVCGEFDSIIPTDDHVTKENCH